MKSIWIFPVLISILILSIAASNAGIANAQTLIATYDINGFGIGCNMKIGTFQNFQDPDLTIRATATITHPACIPDGSPFTADLFGFGTLLDTGTVPVAGGSAVVSGLVPVACPHPPGPLCGTPNQFNVRTSFPNQGFGSGGVNFVLGNLPNIDNDDDGFDSVASGGDDCDDSDNSIFPGAPETSYDGVDSNCDGLDPDDVDVDGFPSTLVIGGTDCDDGDNTIFPGAAEVSADGIDQDCDGFSDEGLSDELFLQIANLQSDLATALADLATALADLADALATIAELEALPGPPDEPGQPSEPGPPGVPTPPTPPRP